MTSRQVAIDGLSVADVMTIDPVVIEADASLDSAVELMRAYGIAGLPVVDGRGSLLGVISQTDLIGAAASPLVGKVVRGQPERFKVGELMSQPALTVRLADPLAHAARVMTAEHVHRVVVIDDAGRPVGVLSAMDFVALFAD
jgi:CBS domain-containing protein